MEVLIGNPHAVEKVGDDYRHIGYQQTRLLLPALDEEESFNTVLEVMKEHMVEGSSPSSVFSYDPDFTNRLNDHYGLRSRSILNIRTNGGADYVANLLGNPASNGTGAYAPASWMGVSASTSALLATDTSLAGEITSGALARAQTTFAHTTGTSSYSVSKIFTSDQTVTLAKDGVFNVATGGTLYWEELFPSPIAMVSGTQVSITATITY